MAKKLHLFTLTAVVASLLSLPSLCSAQDAGVTTTWPVGRILDPVATAANPQQSYALYLPPSYDPARRWPLILAFDPAARGRVPVELLQPAADKYGFIVAGSNNSRNGPSRPQVEAFQAMWNDLLTRFPVDAQRVYAAGFSGGARVATLMGHLCPRCLAGVLGSGAGFSNDVPVTKDVPFVYFSAVGRYDYSYAEIVELLEKLDAVGVPNTLREFDGVHQWAPPEVLTEGVEWMELLAMARGRRPRDDNFIEAQWAKRLAAAKVYSEQRNWWNAYRMYKEMQSSFSVLRDVSDAVAALRALEGSDELRAARKRQARAVERQLDLTQPFVEQFHALRQTAIERASLAADVRARLGDLRRRREREKDLEELAILRRSLGDIFAIYFEGGETMLREKDYSLAAVYFQVAAEAAPRSPWVEYNMACAYALGGRKKDALAALRRAAEKGFTDSALLASDKDLDSLHELPEYKQLLDSLAAPR